MIMDAASADPNATNPTAADQTAADPHALARQAQQRAIRARRLRQQRQARAAQTGRAPAAPLAVRSPAQRQGRKAEGRASAYLRGRGLVTLASNLVCKAGEIDLVCRDGATLVFVEVRERRNGDFGGPAASIGPAKQRRLTLAAHFWLPHLTRRYFQGIEPPCRFDAVTLDGQSITWIRAAFMQSHGG